MNIVAIIPARFGSSRLPGKPLSEIDGRPMVQHVWERARQARRPCRVIVATDDERIAAAVQNFGGEVVMTSAAHASGTDRLAEVARTLEAEIVANVQGDEPLLDPLVLDAAIDRLLSDSGLDLATAATPLRDTEEWLSPDVVKVVCDGAGRAQWFSRRPIPAVRGARDEEEASRLVLAGELALRHVGLYVYRRQALLRLAELPPTPLEQAEGLEQLRALHHGMPVGVVRVVCAGGPSVDTAEDLERVRALVAEAAGAQEGR